MSAWYKLVSVSILFFVFLLISPCVLLAQEVSPVPCNQSFDPEKIREVAREQLSEGVNANAPDRDKTCIWGICLEDIVMTGFINAAVKVYNLVSGTGATDVINELGACSDSKMDPFIDSDGNCMCVLADEYAVVPAAKLCNSSIVIGASDTQAQQDRKLEAYEECVQCALQSGIWTALGCIYITNPQDFVTRNVFGLGLGIAGVSSFICILSGGVMIMLSRGNAEKVKQARELMTSCVTGLLIIILSVLILRVIGVDILRIPGLQ